MNQFVVKQDSFEGPLDLLLQLIEKRRLHVSDVSLARVADDYIEHIERIEEFPMEQSANFVLVASTLLLIKSKSLLPTLELTLEEEQNINDLEDRLKEYARIKELSRHVEQLFGKKPLFASERATAPTPFFTPSKEIGLPALSEAIAQIIRALPVPEKLAQAVVKKIISLEEAIDTLAERIKQGLKMSFKDFANAHTVQDVREARVAVVVSFLAMLELVKRGSVTVSQHKHFGDITMETGDVGVPHY